MKKLPPIAWSYSRLSVYRQCPKWFWYKFIRKLEEPTSPQQMRGLLVHGMLEKYVRNNVLAKGKDPSLAKEFKHLRGEIDLIRDTGGKPELELAFTRKWEQVSWFDPTVWLRVKIDVQHFLEPKHVRVLDYKTGLPKPEKHEESLRLYGLATLLTEKGLKQLTTGVWYVDYEKKPQILGVYDGNLRRIIKDEQKYWEEQSAKLGKETRWKATPGRVCTWCPFSCKKQYGPEKSPGRAPKQRESSIENAFLRWLKKRDPRALTRKMNGLGFRDWPDRQILKPRVLPPLWMEFKLPGKDATESQAEVQRRIAVTGSLPVVCTSVDEAKRAYEKHR